MGYRQLAALLAAFLIVNGLALAELVYQMKTFFSIIIFMGLSAIMQLQAQCKVELYIPKKGVKLSFKENNKLTFEQLEDIAWIKMPQKNRSV